MLIHVTHIKRKSIMLATTVLVLGGLMSGITPTQSIIYAAKSSIRATDITIKTGEVFDPKVGVTGKDSTGNDTTDQITVIGAVDSNKPGEYILAYILKDSTGEITNVNRIVTVEDLKLPIEEKKGTIKIGALFEKKYLPGVTIAICDKNSREILRVITTEELTSIELPYGEYAAIPQVFPEGYAVERNPFKPYNVFKIESKFNEANVIVDVRKAVSPFAVSAIEKEGDSFKPLVGGVVFEVKNLNGDIVYTGNINDVISDFILPDGDYTIHMKIPSGYRLSEETPNGQKAFGYGRAGNIYSFQFEKMEVTKELSTIKENQKELSTIKEDSTEFLPSTGVTKDNLGVISISIMIGSLGVIIRKLFIKK